MKESRVNRYKMYKSGKHLVFSLIMSFSVGAILSSSNFLSFDSNDDLHLFLHAKADNVSSNIDWNNWQTAFTVPSANGDLTGSKGHIVVSGIGLKTDVKDGYVQGDTQPTVTLDAYTLRYSKGSAANSISWSKLNGANISNVVLTDPNGNTQSISGWQFLDINGNVTQNLDNAVWVSFPLTSSNGRITYSNNAQGNTWGFNQKFTLSFDLDIPDEAEKPGYKSYRKAVTNQTEPQVVKSYYRDVNNNGDLSNPDKVGVGGSWGQSVTAQAKDLTSQGYYFVKSSEYINDDNHVASSQNSSMSHQLNSDKIADVFYYSNSASVTAKYVDEHNNTLHPDNTYSGVTGETYKTQSINIPNYHLVKVNGEESGNYAMPVNNKSVGNNPVVYEYEPDRESATVQYIDDNTGKILESHNLTGGYGTTDSYSTQDTIKKYENDGYVVVSDNYPSNGVTYNSDTQTFQVHLDNIKLQKETQKGNLKNEHDRVVQAINADPTLTSDEKQKQVQAADQSLQDNDGKVDQAKDADAINAAMAAGKQAIDATHQAGTPVADQQAAQKKSLQAEHDRVVQAINADPTLTSDEKQKQVQAADQSLQDNDGKVDQAKDADAINAAMAAGKQAIDATHQAGTPVADQQAAQKKSLQAEHDRVVQAINADPTLTSDEKQKQVQAADQSLQDNDGKVDQAKDADAINAAMAAGKQAIDATHQAGTPVADQQAAQKKSLQAEHDRVVQAINADPTLTSDEKQKQVQAADQSLQDNDGKVDQAKDADAINAAMAAGKQAIDATHQAGTPVADQQAAQKKSLQAEHDRVVQAINADPTLTSDEKQKQVQAADQSLQDNDGKVDQAKDADAINAAMAAGKQAIDATHQAGTPVADQQAAQKKSLQAEHDRVVQAINADPTLTSDEKQKQVQAADQSLQDNDGKVDQAKDADAINAAMAAGKQAIDATHQAGTPVADQQAAQKKSLQAEHDRVVQAINADPTLTSDEKQKQVQAADQSLQDNDGKVDQAKDADAINAAMAAGKQAIDATHQAGTPVADQQAAQKKSLQAEHDRVVQAINADSTLTSDEKQKQVQAADQSLQGNDGKVDQAKDADAINAAMAAGKQAIDATHQAGTPVADQQAAQKKSLQAEHDRVVQAINADPTLTSDEKQKQVQAADQSLQDNDGKVDQAKDADAINAAMAAGKQAIDATHQAGTPVADQQAAQKKSLQAEHDRVVQAINADPTLTSDEKQKQVQAADQSLQDNDGKVDQAKDADAINAAMAAGKQAIDATHQAGTPVADQQAAQKKSLQAEHDRVVQAINADSTLTSDEKQKQVQAADQSLQGNDGKVDQAKDADAINAAMAAGKQAIDATHQAGTPVADQQAAQKKSLQAEHDRVVQAINADPTLTSDEKQKQVQAADQSLQDNDGKVDQAKDADAINAAMAAGKQAIDATHQAGTPVADQQAAQKKSLQAEHDRVVQAINADPTLTSDEKQKQVQAADQSLQDNDGKVDQAKDADAINAAMAAGKQAIDATHQAGTPVADQQAAQKKSLQAEHDRVVQAINADPTLTSDEKQKQVQAADQSLQDNDGKVDQAKDADAINAAMAAGKQAIDATHQAGTPVADQQAAQKKSLQAEHDRVVQAINADPTLTSDEKQKQVQAADQSLQDNDGKVDQAKDADAINAAMAAGKQAIDATHQAGTPVADQQAAQKKSLQAEHDRVVQAINADPTLTSDEKQKQVQAADQSLQDNDGKVDQAKDADAINAAMAAGKQAIDATHQAGTPVADQQAAQKKSLQAEHDRVVQAINADPTLTSDEKQKQVQAADQSLQDNDGKVDQAKDADAINAAMAAGKQAIDATHQAGTPVADQQAAQKKSLQAEHDRVVQAINADPTLTSDEKQKQVQAADQSLQDNDGKVDQAKDADAINAAMAAGKQAIDATHQAGTPVADQQAAQKKSLLPLTAKINHKDNAWIGLLVMIIGLPALLRKVKNKE